MKKVFLFFFMLIVIFISYFMLLTKGKGSYKHSELLGYSRSIEESMRRKVFIKKLNFKVIPDSIKTNEKVVFFIERRWRYGTYSSEETIPIKEDELKYSFLKEQNKDLFKNNEFSLGKGDSITFNLLKDTIMFDIIYRKDIGKLYRNQYDSIFKLGKIILYPDSKSNDK